MPNWTSITIHIEGKPADVRAFLEFVKWEDRLFDFNRLIPMPEILKRVVAGFTVIDGKDVRYCLEGKDEHGNVAMRCVSPEEQNELKRLGYLDWYDWAVAHWGTKWNACHVEVDVEQVAQGYAEILFDTAWDAPLPVLRKMVEMFPALSFQCSWEHEGDHRCTHFLDELEE